MTTPPTATPPPDQQRPKTAPSKRTASIGRGVRTGLYIVITVLTTLFLLSNSQSVEVNYIVGSAQTPLFVALAVALLLGVLLALGGVGIWKVRHRDTAKT